MSRAFGIKALKIILPFLVLAGVLMGATRFVNDGINEHELTRVAKDWSMVVRASQVIPVYPLTEDLQPGDILLVNTPIEQQVDEYKKRGFLPLDQFLKRLNPVEAYHDFYGERYGLTKEKGKQPAAHWQQSIDDQLQWGKAPRVSFPSYSFSVNTQSGMNLAIPVQGVPIAMSAMNAGSANGSVTITDAYTYGLDNAALIKLVNDWANSNRSILKGLAPMPVKPSRFNLFAKEGEAELEYQFLRVIARVYVVSGVNISLFADNQNAVQVDKALDKDAIQDKDKLLDIKSASNRSISLNETFPRPLVLGYLGFDFPILKHGRLGAPISTLARLNNSPVVNHDGGLNIISSKIIAYRALVYALSDLDDANDLEARRIINNLNTLSWLLPSEYKKYKFSRRRSGELLLGDETVVKIDDIGFKTITVFIAQQQSYIREIDEYLIKYPDNEELVLEKQMVIDRIKEIDRQVGRSPYIVEALDYIFY